MILCDNGKIFKIASNFTSGEQSKNEFSFRYVEYDVPMKTSQQLFWWVVQYEDLEFRKRNCVLRNNP